MQRVLRAITNYVTGFATRVADGWNTFWYTPVDPGLLGFIRILTGLMLLYTHAVWGMALNDFFGADAWISRELVDVVLTNQERYSNHFAYSLWWVIPPRWIIWLSLLRPLVLAASVVMHLGIGACLGLWTFSLIMLVDCASFLPTEGVGRLVAALSSPRAPAKVNRQSAESWRR
jgi:hypothetical protein